MTNNQKGFAGIVLLVAVVILAGIGYVAFIKKSEPVTEQPAPAQTETPTPPTPTTLDETSGWKIYKNEEYGVSFLYPPNFQVVTDKIQSGPKWYRIELTDVSVPERPFMRFEIDPDGYGPFFPDKTYRITESSSGEVSVDSVKNSGSENSDDGRVSIIPNVLEATNGHSYYWQFSFNESGKDYEPLFNQILSTFKFTK